MIERDDLDMLAAEFVLGTLPVEDRQRVQRLRTTHPELDAQIDYPGPWARLNRTPITFRGRAPRIGEHNGEIYRDLLGLDGERLEALAQAHVI